MKDGKFEKVEGTDFELEADLVLLAMGFVGPERDGLLTDLGVELNDRGNVARDDDFQTSVPGVFVAGDMGRGQSLIVWAIAEGRAAAAGVRPLPDGPDGAARADQAHRRTAAITATSAGRGTVSSESHPSLQSLQPKTSDLCSACLHCLPAQVSNDS